MSAATATNVPNYAIDQGVTVSAAAVVNQTMVILTTSAINAGPTYTLTVNGVSDWAGNAIATNSQIVIVVPAVTITPPPSTNRLLWLEADKGVLTNSAGVSEWDDQSGATNEHNALHAFGNAQVGQVAFPNGNHPVVSFDGTAGLAVDNTVDFNLQDLSIYIVGDVDNTYGYITFLATWAGWAVGTDNPGVFKWTTYQGGNVIAMEAPSVVGNKVPTLLEGTFVYPGDKTLAINGTQVGFETNAAPIDYSGANGLTVGGLLPWGTQNLVGDVAEILVYSDVSPAQDAAVQSYLTSKYGIPASRINIAGPASNGTITLSWNGATATLQSADVITGPWSDVTGASSPYVITPSQAQKFYRLKQ